MTAEEKKRKKKKQSSVLEAELFRIMEKSLKAAMDKALDDIVNSGPTATYARTFSHGITDF